MNRLTVISKNINKREINMVVVHSFTDAHKEALDAMERGCDEAVVEDEVHNVVFRLIKPKKTNFDRITESPEKMAEFLATWFVLPCKLCEHFRHDKCTAKISERYCDEAEAFEKWLNEECKK